MYRLVGYTELDNSIQTYMSNQAPSSTDRLEYMNNFMKELSTKYNIEVARRSVEVELTPDGNPVDIDNIITELDLNKIDNIREIEDDVPTTQYFGIKEDKFQNNYNSGARLNEWSFYTSDGKRYLRLNSADHSDEEAVTYQITYFTSNLAYNTDTEEYMSAVEADDDCYLLIPYNYKRLAITGICRDLFPISLGKDGETPAAIANNRYESQLKQLGLSGEGKKIKTDVRKVKIYRM